MKVKLLPAIGFIVVFGYALVTVGYNIRKDEFKEPVVETVSALQPVDPVNAERIFQLVNDHRTESGLPELKSNPEAQQAALNKCTDMVQGKYYAHISPHSGRHGYMFAVELIPNGLAFNENLNKVEGDSTNEAIVNSWKESPSHNTAILDVDFTDAGVAVCKDGQTTYAVQEFVKL